MMCHSHLLSVFLGFATFFFELASSKDEGACRILVLEKILCLEKLENVRSFSSLWNLKLHHDLEEALKKPLSTVTLFFCLKVLFQYVNEVQK